MDQTWMPCHFLHKICCTCHHQFRKLQQVKWKVQWQFADKFYKRLSYTIFCQYLCFMWHFLGGTSNDIVGSGSGNGSQGLCSQFTIICIR